MTVNTVDLNPDLFSVSFHDDMAILVDIYNDEDDVDTFLEKVIKSGCPPEQEKYPLSFVAKEVFIPRVVDIGAGSLLKKLSNHMSGKQFRQILTCLFINDSGIAKSFMSEVYIAAKERGRSAIYAKQIFDFCERWLIRGLNYNAFEDFDTSLEVKKADVLMLTKQIIQALSCHGILNQMPIHQDSQSMAFSFNNLEMYDTTIIFLMYWQKNIGSSATVAINHEIWGYLGISKVDLVKRMSAAPMDKFFDIGFIPDTNIGFGYSNTLEGINRMRVLNT